MATESPDERRPAAGPDGSDPDPFDEEGRFPAWVTRTATYVRRELLRVARRSRSTVLPPIVTNALYVTVFGVILGARIGEIDGVSYLQFVLPGLIGLGAISQSFQNSAFSLFHARWEEYVETTLASPLTHAESIVSLLAGSAARGGFVAVAVYLLGVLFADVPLRHPLLFVAFLAVVIALFGGIGIIVGLWAENFDQMTVFNQFLIRPLVFFGGVFFPISDLPASVRFVGYLNPMVYIVNGLRYSLLGISTVPPLRALVVLTAVALLVLGVDLWLFRRGYGLTE